MKRPGSLFLLVLLLLAAGCSTFDSRVREKSDVFAQLDEATQNRLRNHELHVGDTEDMVYIALGKPDEMRGVTNSNGSSMLWVYNAYWQSYQGTRFVGYRRQVVYDSGSKSYKVYYEPVEEPVWESRVEERIRVTFTNGVVSVVEQVLP